MKAMANTSIRPLPMDSISRGPKKAITAKLVELKAGKEVVNYKLRDWIFSRQRYWGEPIPIVQTEDKKEHAIDEKELPLVLPELDDYRPTKDGKPPLARATDWLKHHLSWRESHPRDEHHAAVGWFVLVLYALSRSAQ
jgi:leucyl-tRNA synthetase